MTEQLSLFAPRLKVQVRPRASAAEVESSANAEEVKTLVTLLSMAATWITARELTKRLGWNDRHIRAVAAASNGMIISGNNGYKHTRYADESEFNEFYGRLINQAEEMNRRAVKAREVHFQ